MDVRTEIHQRDLMTVAQAVLRLGVTKQRVHQLIDDGKLQVVMLGRFHFVTRESVERRRSLRAGQDGPSGVLEG